MMMNIHIHIDFHFKKQKTQKMSVWFSTQLQSEHPLQSYNLQLQSFKNESIQL